MNLLTNLIVRSLAIFVTANLAPGVKIDNIWTALIVAVVLGAVNLLIRPILLILTLPINLFTLGLFTLVINGLMVLLASNLVHQFKVESFGSAVLFGIILWLVNLIFHSVLR